MSVFRVTITRNSFNIHLIIKMLQISIKTNHLTKISYEQNGKDQVSNFNHKRLLPNPIDMLSTCL